MKTEQDDIDYLRAFSADVIASLTLAQNYDLKKVAYAIDNLLNEEFGTLISTKENKSKFKCAGGDHRYNYDLFDTSKEKYCIDCGCRAT